jgi:hypothetical protein
MLCAALTMNGLYSTGRFIIVAPAHNTQVRDAVHLYRQHLLDDPSIPFDAITIELVVDAIRSAGASDIADLLQHRYCDFAPLEALI